MKKFLFLGHLQSFHLALTLPFNFKFSLKIIFTIISNQINHKICVFRYLRCMILHSGRSPDITIDNNSTTLFFLHQNLFKCLLNKIYLLIFTNYFFFLENLKFKLKYVFDIFHILLYITPLVFKFDFYKSNETMLSWKLWNIAFYEVLFFVRRNGEKKLWFDKLKKIGIRIWIMKEYNSSIRINFMKKWL